MKRVTVPSFMALFAVFLVQLSAAPFFQYYDWESTAPIVRFSEHFSPPHFMLETDTQREQRAVERSLFWGRGGTQLESVRAELRNEEILLLFSTRSETAAGLSVNLHIFPTRITEGAMYTVEIPVSEMSGPVVLWSMEHAEPRVVGSYLRRAFYVEVRVPLAHLPADLNDIPFPQLSLDLRTSYFDGGRHEGFHHVTIYPAELGF